MAVGVAALYSFTLSFIMLKLIEKTIGLRISDEEEVMGLDLTQHEESGYTL
jgi:Amt family ammonium transporter